MWYVAWKRWLPRKCARFVLFCPIKKRFLSSLVCFVIRVDRGNAQRISDDFTKLFKTSVSFAEESSLLVRQSLQLFTFSSLYCERLIILCPLLKMNTKEHYDKYVIIRPATKHLILPLRMQFVCHTKLLLVFVSLQPEESIMLCAVRNGRSKLVIHWSLWQRVRTGELWLRDEIRWSCCCCCCCC